MYDYYFKEKNSCLYVLLGTIAYRDVTTGATGATAVAPKFSDTLTLFQPGGQILPTIGAVAPKFSSWLRPCYLYVDKCHNKI